MPKSAVVLGLLAFFGSLPDVYAFEPASGELVATASCRATTNITETRNPGNVTLRINAHYPIVGFNKPDGSYVEVTVAGAHPEARWVKRSCGTLTAGESAPRSEDKYDFAISWQAAFCESKPDKAECRTQTANRFDATHFTLHGLWPEPRQNVYCGVSSLDRSRDIQKQWDQLPEPTLSNETRTRLNMAMPGTISKLQRHEYTKHGSCFPGNAETYFRVAIHLLDQINKSSLQAIMAEKTGTTVSTAQLKRAFEQSFGAGSGKLLGVHCLGDLNSRRTLINELQIRLRGPLTETSKLSEVFDKSTQAGSDCSEGIVDPVGLQ